MVEFEKVLYCPDLKMVLIFLVTKVFQKGAMFKWVSNEMLRHAMVSDKPGGLSVQPPTPPGKLNWQHSKNRLLAILVRSIYLDAIFIAVPVEHYPIWFLLFVSIINQSFAFSPGKIYILLVDSVILHWYAVGTGERTVTWLPKFLGQQLG